MRVDLPLGLVWDFLAVFARIAGIFAFLPLPGLKTPVDPPRILLALLLTLALFPQWPETSGGGRTAGDLALLAVREAILGILCGLLIGFVVEVFQLTSQLLAQQAGFSYASTIDPTNDTDSGVLMVLTQLLAGLLALGAGLDRHVIKTLARSLESIPPGTFSPSLNHLDTVSRLGTKMLETGLLLALPSIAIFLVLDILLAVLSRLEQQLQLTTILFPAKTASAIFITTIAIGSFASAFEGLMGAGLAAMRLVLGL